MSCSEHVNDLNHPTFTPHLNILDTVRDSLEPTRLVPNHIHHTMSADTVTNPPPAESNTARKKREKAEAAKAEATPAVSSPTEEQAEPSTNGALSQHDSPYVKELQK